MEYKGLKLFGYKNLKNEPVPLKISDMGFVRPDTGEFMAFAECPICGMESLSRIVCQFCGQRFIEDGEEG